MMKIEFEDVIIEVPEGWKDIKLSDYEKWYILEPKTKKELVEYTAKVCKVDVNVLLESPPQLFEDIFNAIQFVFSSEVESKSKLTIDGVNFFVPKYNYLTLAEYVDIDTIMNSESKSKLSEILAIVCRPLGEKYEGDNEELNEERIEVFKNLNCSDAIPILSFFFLNRKESEKILSLCLMVRDQINQLLHLIKASALNGDGIKRLQIWRGMKYYFLMRSLRKKLSKYSASYYTESIKQ